MPASPPGPSYAAASGWAPRAPSPDISIPFGRTWRPRQQPGAEGPSGQRKSPIYRRLRKLAFRKCRNLSYLPDQPRDHTGSTPYPRRLHTVLTLGQRGKKEGKAGLWSAEGRRQDSPQKCSEIRHLRYPLAPETKGLPGPRHRGPASASGAPLRTVQWRWRGRTKCTTPHV